MSSFVTLQSGIPILQSVAGIGAAYETYTTLGVDLTGSYTLPNGQTYNLGNKELQVFVDGIRKEVGLDFTEASTTSIAFLATVKAGSTIVVRQ